MKDDSVALGLCIVSACHRLHSAQVVLNSSMLLLLSIEQLFPPTTKEQRPTERLAQIVKDIDDFRLKMQEASQAIFGLTAEPLEPAVIGKIGPDCNPA